MPCRCRRWRVRRVRHPRRRQGNEHDDGLRALAHQPAEGPVAGPTRGADRRRRSAHLRHGQPVQADRHLLQQRPGLRAGGHRLVDELPRSHRRSDSGRRHQRGRRDQQLDGRGDQSFGARPLDAAVLHLLLDVRFPTGGRPDLGRRRPAGTRLPARCHCRAHHAWRRGLAAPGRREPAARVDGAELPRLRPLFRGRIRGHPGPRYARNARTPARRLLLRHADERELPAAFALARHGNRHRQGSVPPQQLRGGRRDGARAAARFGHDPARGHGRGRAA